MSLLGDLSVYLVGVMNSLMSIIYFSIFWLLLFPGLDLPSTVIFISPSNFMSALTSVLIDKLPRLNTSLLYFENLCYIWFTCTNYSRTHEVTGYQVDVL